MKKRSKNHPCRIFVDVTTRLRTKLSTMNKQMRRGYVNVLMAFVWVVGVLSSGDALARDLFTVMVIVDGQEETRSYNNAETALKVFETTRIGDIFPTYMKGTTDIAAAVDFRGMNSQVNYKYENGISRLIFEVPSLDIRKVFDDPTHDPVARQDKLVDEFVDFLKKDGGDILNRIQKKLAEVSPVDPVAGNPNSLQSNLVKDGFNAGAFDVGRKPSRNQLGLSIAGSSFSVGGFSGQSISVPLSYAINFDTKLGTRLSIKLPVTYTKIQEAEIFNVNPGLALTVHLTDRWSLTPAVGYGLVGSKDAASVAQMLTGMVTSSYLFIKPDWDTAFTLGNSVGYVGTLKFSAQGYNFNPGISNTIFKNGLMIERPIGIHLFGNEELTLQVSYAHSYFAGSALFMNQYHEVALSLGSAWEELSFITDEVRLGFTSAFGDNYGSIGVNFGYEF